MICRHGRSKHSESRFYFSFQCYINGFNCVKYERIFKGITLRAHQNSSSHPPPPSLPASPPSNYHKFYELIEEIANRRKQILSTILYYELYPSETSNIFVFCFFKCFYDSGSFTSVISFTMQITLSWTTRSLRYFLK